MHEHTHARTHTHHEHACTCAHSCTETHACTHTHTTTTWPPRGNTQSSPLGLCWWPRAVFTKYQRGRRHRAETHPVTVLETGPGRLRASRRGPFPATLGFWWSRVSLGCGCISPTSCRPLLYESVSSKDVIMELRHQPVQDGLIGSSLTELRSEKTFSRAVFSRPRTCWATCAAQQHVTAWSQTGGQGDVPQSTAHSGLPKAAAHPLPSRGGHLGPDTGHTVAANLDKETSSKATSRKAAPGPAKVSSKPRSARDQGPPCSRQPSALPLRARGGRPLPAKQPQLQLGNACLVPSTSPLPDSREPGIRPRPALTVGDPLCRVSCF